MRRKVVKKYGSTGRIGPGLIGFAIAAAALKRKRQEEEEQKYAESHGGHKVPRRKKGAGDGDKRAGR